MTIELTMLLLAALLALVQIGLYAAAVLPKVGVPYVAGARDEEQEPGAMGGRLKRAYQNHLETLPVFAIAVLVAHITGQANATTAFAAQVYLVARIAYVPAYAFGIPYLRSIIWGIATAAIVVIVFEALA
jgi:uncharacterized MAPEG superfamily protein